MKVGYVGVGTMGGALARRLMQSRPLMVFDSRPEIVEQMVRDGATPAPDAATLARECDVIMVCVPTSAVVRRVIFGPGGLADTLSPGKIVIDQTTGSPSETRAIAAHLEKLGVTMIDAPVSGGTRGAVATIAIICGGPQEAFEKVRPILREISPNIVYCGGIGNGHAAKLVQNAVAGCNRVITYECAAVACRCGVTLAELAEPIRQSSGWNGGAERIIPALGTDRQTTDFRMFLAVKDLRLALEIGDEVGAPMMVANIVRSMFQICINQKGPTKNLDEVAYVIEEMSGLKFTEHGGV
jgi:3-hydroxyisobutyrate dehydrogenase